MSNKSRKWKSLWNTVNTVHTDKDNLTAEEKVRSLIIYSNASSESFQIQGRKDGLENSNKANSDMTEGRKAIYNRIKTSIQKNGNNLNCNLNQVDRRILNQ